MQPTQKLTQALRSLLALVEQEAMRNPSFAKRLEEITAPLPAPSAARRRTRNAGPAETPPNIFAVREEKGEEEFRFWLQSLNLRMLKAIVKANGFDPGKSSQRWTEPDKFVQLIADQTAARLRRGTAFLGSRNPKDDEGKQR
jgi:hypothetical protein